MKKMNLYRILSVHWSGNEGRKQEEFVIANDISQVIEYLKTDLNDKGMEVESIIKEVPVTKILAK